MKFQSKALESTTDFRRIAATLAALAVARAQTLKPALTTLKVAGLELNQVARRHVAQLVKQNAAIAREAGKDVSSVARTAFSSLSQGPAKPVRKARKTVNTRKRAAKVA